MKCKNQGNPRSMDYRPFRLTRPKFACKARSTPDPKTIQSKAMYIHRLSGTLIECLRFCRGVETPQVQKSSHSGINGFPAISADPSLVRVQRKLNTCSKHDPVQAMYNSRLSGTLIRCLRLCRGVARFEVKKSGHSGINGFPAISADSSLVRVQGKINT